MSSTVQYLVDRIIDTCNQHYDTKKDDITDCIHTQIDDYVSCNHFLDNIEIINQEVGGIYEAIMLYENTFGEFDQAKDMTRPIFYARLAFISLYEIVSQKVLTQQDNHTD